MTVQAASRADVVVGARAAGRARGSRSPIQAFLILTAAVWLLPPVWAVYTSLRPYAETAQRGYVSLPNTLNFQNYINAWIQADLPHYYGNTLIVVVPAMILILTLSSFVAFVIARFPFRFNLALLMLFTAGNLLPQQVIITPLYRLYLLISLPSGISDSGKMYDTLFGLIIIHIAFQSGFCTFVLSNYMKALPQDLTEAAFVDGAGVWRQYWSIIMPLTRPAFAALGTLEVIWIYNDFFWPLLLIQSGNRLPITTAIHNLQGQFLSNYNLLAAGAIITIIPTLIIYIVLQKQFVAGLTLGASKG